MGSDPKIATSLCEIRAYSKMAISFRFGMEPAFMSYEDGAIKLARIYRKIFNKAPWNLCGFRALFLCALV
jgi:hypothetical protein